MSFLVWIVTWWHVHFVVVTPIVSLVHLKLLHILLTCNSSLRVMILEVSSLVWIRLIRIACTLSTLNFRLWIIRVNLHVPLHLNMLLLFEDLVLLIYIIHFLLYHIIQAMVLGFVLNFLDEFHQDFLTPFHLNFVVCYLLEGGDNWVYHVISLFFSFTIWGNRVLKHEISKLALDYSM